MADSTKGIQMIAYITGQKSRVLGGAPLMLYEECDEEREKLSVDVAKAMKCDVIHMKNGDFLLIKN